MHGLILDIIFICDKGNYSREDSRWIKKVLKQVEGVHTILNHSKTFKVVLCFCF